MRPLVPVLLVVAVVLAGCGGVFGDGEETATLTPAAVPTDEPTPTPVPRLAPGLTRDGVADAGALAAAHAAALDGRSFTVRRTMTYRTGTGMPVRELTSVARVARDGRFLVQRRWTGETTLRCETAYFDGERLLVATTDAENDTEYHEAPPSSARVATEAGGERIERVFTAAETRVVARSDRGETTVYRLAPVERTRSNASGPGQSVRVRARITARGFVRSYTLDQGLSERQPGDPSSIVVSTRYTDVGSTTVERPAWYRTAMAAANATTDGSRAAVASTAVRRQ